MKSIVKYLTGLVLLLTFSGCIPDQAVIWSPDGKQAVVLSDVNLYRCTPDGALSEKLLEGVFRAAWLSDSTHLVVARTAEFTAWSDAAELLLPEERARLMAISDNVNASYKETGDLEMVAKEVIELEDLSGAEAGLIGLYVNENYPELIEAAELEDDEPISAELYLIEVVELRAGVVQSKRRVGSGWMLPIWSLRVSPDDKAVAFSCGEVIGDDADPATLYVAALNGDSGAVKVADNAALYPDWSRDGQWLLFAASNIEFSSDDLVLGSISRCRVADENGLLEQIPSPEELVGVIMNPLTRVRCLPDNSIVFSALEVSLPAVAGDMPEYMNFFRFDPQRPATAERMFPRRIEPYLGDSSTLFEPSPDGQRIAFIDSEDRIAVITVATGELIHIQKSMAEPDSLPPSWRNNNELTCVTQTTNGVSVIRYSLDSATEPVEMSASWPEEMLDGIFDD
ncbi:MAG: hypothetical protein JXR23_00385 [Pontiellaceae bacterium]|nr:hypothetical protein [Pontiellaceae bacterium]